MRYDAVFLDVDGTLLWVDLDVEGYVQEPLRYASNGPVTVERATGPVWEGCGGTSRENIEYRTRDHLADFKRRNAAATAERAGTKGPGRGPRAGGGTQDLVQPVPRVREPYCANSARPGVGMYVVSNWDLELVDVLDGLDWTRYFDGIVVSAVSGIEKPDRRLFEEALEVAASPGNAPYTLATIRRPTSGSD